MRFTLHIWRQKSRAATGQMTTYALDDVSPDMSFLEMLDQLNEKLVKDGQEPVAFDQDCREGICGSCAMMVNGLAHGPERAHDRLPTAHAKFRGRGSHPHRALAREGVPGGQGPGL